MQKNLRGKQEGGWTKIFIDQDLTPKQREARKPLVAELQQQKANGKRSDNFQRQSDDDVIVIDDDDNATDRRQYSPASTSPVSPASGQHSQR